MGLKFVCFTCHKAFSRMTIAVEQPTCPECGHVAVFYPHRFRPPKRTDSHKWEVVRFFYENGFTYQHIISGGYDKPFANQRTPYAQYPENLAAAREFVQHYSSQAKNHQP